MSGNRKHLKDNTNKTPWFEKRNPKEAKNK